MDRTPLLIRAQGAAPRAAWRIDLKGLPLSFSSSGWVGTGSARVLADKSIFDLNCTCPPWKWPVFQQLVGEFSRGLSRVCWLPWQRLRDDPIRKVWTRGAPGQTRALRFSFQGEM
ncbi:hypothetical protein KIL84_015967 [Mauremys mutica]|uniref:Uncharacterized protein n=1 Tax=Mauremys mutica TaxID=74926 RepID=A0A9D3WU36_9SAUR|nr:hypothetical protein KIL84_015967 [Mauremys mutica]